MDFYPLFLHETSSLFFVFVLLVGLVEPDFSMHWAGRRGRPEAVIDFPLVMICPFAQRPHHLDLLWASPLSLKLLASQ